MALTSSICPVAGCSSLLGISDLPGLDGSVGPDPTGGSDGALDGNVVAADAEPATDGGLDEGGGEASEASSVGREAGEPRDSGPPGAADAAPLACANGAAVDPSCGCNEATLGLTDCTPDGSAVRQCNTGADGGPAWQDVQECTQGTVCALEDLMAGYGCYASATSCCTGLAAGQTECCQYGQTSCNDAGASWANTGAGCSPASLNGAVTDPSCVGTIVVCK